MSTQKLLLLTVSSVTSVFRRFLRRTRREVNYSDLLTGYHIPFVTTYRCFHSGFTCQRGDCSCCCSWKKTPRTIEPLTNPAGYMHLIILIALVLLSWALFSIRWQLCMAKRCAEARSQGARETLVTPIKAKEVSKWVKISVFWKAWLSFSTFDEVLESWTLLRLLWGAISSVCGKCNSWRMYDWSDGWLHLDRPTVLSEVILPRRWSPKVRCVKTFRQDLFDESFVKYNCACVRSLCKWKQFGFGSFTYTASYFGERCLELANKYLKG